MNCPNCHKEVSPDQKFCTNCGYSLIGDSTEPKKTKTAQPVNTGSRKTNGSNLIARIVIFLIIIGLGSYWAIDNAAIDKNNNAITQLQSGNTSAAIEQLKEASSEVTQDDNKVNTLKNLAYAYDTDGNYTEALSTFKQALPYAKTGSADAYLIQGEIDYYEANYGSAEKNYLAAERLSSDDFQIENELAIFYLDLESKAPTYQNYPKALSHAQKAYALSKTETTQSNLGISYFFNDDYDKAISTLSTIDSKNHPYINVWLGMTYLGKQDAEDAKIYFQKALDAGIDLPDEIDTFMAS